MDDRDDYSARIAVAVYEAVVLASAEDGDVAVIRSGPAFEGLMSVAALLIAGSPELETARDIREFCEEAAKSLRQRIVKVRASPEAAEILGTSPRPPKGN